MTRSPRQLLWPGSKVNPRAKKMTFSSAENNEILGGIIRDRSEVLGMVGAEVMEEALITGLLPKDSTAKLLASTIYMCGIREALVGLLREVALDKVKMESFGYLPIVQFTIEAIRYSSWAPDKSGAEKNREAIEAIVGLVDKMKEQFATMRLDDSTLDLLKECAEDMFWQPYAVVQELGQQWHHIELMPEAYEVLALLVLASHRVDNEPGLRVRLVELLCEVGDAWQGKGAVMPKEEFIDYAMANGSYVQAPSDWLVANLEDAWHCDYAGVFEVKNGNKYNEPNGAPHILFFCEKPVNRLDEVEVIDLRKSAVTVWPTLEKVYADEVEPIWAVGEDGVRHLANAAEYAAAPAVGMFELQDANPRNSSPFAEKMSKQRPFGAGVFRDWERREEK